MPVTVLFCAVLLLSAILGIAPDGHAQTPLENITKTYDGQDNPVAGATLPYTVTIPNLGTEPLLDVMFSDFPDPLSPLVSGSVTTTQGTVVTGNGPNNSSVLVNVGTIAPGETVTITYETVVCTCIQYPVMISNQGFVNTPSGSTPTDNPVTSTSGDPTDVPVTPQGMSELGVIAKSCDLHTDADGSGLISPDDTVRYTVTVPNAGAVPVVDAVFTDFLDPNTSLVVGSVTTSRGTVLTGNNAGDTHVMVTVGTIDPGETVTITFDVVVSGNVSQISNQGVVNSQAGTISTDDPSTPASADATVCQVFPKEEPQLGPPIKDVSLAVDLDGSGVASPGDTLHYTITIPNTGNVAVPDVVFTDTPDAQTSLVTGSVTTSHGSVIQGNNVTDTQIEVRVPTLPAGETVTIQFDVTINADATGQISNQGTVNTPTGTTPTGPGGGGDGGDGGSGPGPTTTPVSPQGTPEFGPSIKAVSLSVDADGNGVPSQEDTLRYTVTIPNVGTALIPDVVFSDPLAPNTTLVVGSVTTSQGTVTSGNAVDDTSVTVEVGAIIVGDSVTISFEVTINADATGQISNQGTVSSPPTGPTPTDNPNTPAPNDPTVTPVTPKGPPVTPKKQVSLQTDADGSGFASPGDTLRYTITIPNVSIQALPGVLFSDLLDPNTTLIRGRVVTSKGTVISGNGPLDRSVKVDVGTLEPGEVVTIFFDVTINPGATEISNQGVVDTPILDKIPTDNPDTPTPNDPTITQIVPAPRAICEATIIGRPASTVFIVQLEDRSKSLAGNIVSWEWDFGDGLSCSVSNFGGCSARFGNQEIEGTLRSPVHIFTGLGRFVIQLKVTDNQGNMDSGTCTFTFGDPPIAQILDENANDVLDDAEILTAIDYWITGTPLPNSGGKVIGDKMIKTLIDMWIKNTPLVQTK